LAEALALARTAPDGIAHVIQLLVVAKILPDDKRVSIAREAWQAARAIKSNSDRADMLGQAADLLPGAERVEAMTEAFEAANAEPLDEDAAQSLIGLFDRLPAGVREQAQASLIQEFHRGAAKPPRRIKGGAAAERANALFEWAGLLDRYAPFLPETDVRAALAQAWTIDSLPVRLRALAAVAARLPPNERREVLSQAIASARTAEDDEATSRALSHLMAQMPPELVAEAVVVVRGINARPEKAELLLRLAERLPAGEQAPLLAEALAAARAVGDEAPRAATLGTLASHLGGGQRDILLAAAWQIVKSIPIETVRLDQYGLLARHHPPLPIQAEMIDSLGWGRSSFDKLRALAACAPHLADELLPAALAAARGLDDYNDLVSVLLALAPRFTGEAGLELYREALASARDNESESSRAELLVKVAVAVPHELRAEPLADATAAARAEHHPHQRVNWLAALAPLAEGEQRRQLVAAALSAAAEIGDETIRGQAVETLAPLLPADFFAAALEIVAGTAAAPGSPPDEELFAQNALANVPARSYPEPRIRALLALANQAPEGQRAEFLSEALTAARSPASPEARAQLLELVAATLPAEERELILTEVVAAGEEARQRIERLYLADLPEPRRTEKAKELLAGIRNMPYSKERAEVLVELFGGLPDGLVAEALSILWTAADRSESLLILRHLVDQRDAGDFETLSSSLSAYGETPRPQFLAALEALTPVLAKVGGEPAVIAAAEAVLEAGTWWE
jgi:hypothetical protein